MTRNPPDDPPTPGHPYGAGTDCRQIPVGEFRRALRDVLAYVEDDGRLVLTRHGRPVAALISIADFGLLQEADAEVDEALATGRVAEPPAAYETRELPAGEGLDAWLARNDDWIGPDDEVDAERVERLGRAIDAVAARLGLSLDAPGAREAAIVAVVTRGMRDASDPE